MIITLIIGQLWLLVLWNDPDWRTFLEVMNILLACCHLVDLLVRMYLEGGLAEYIEDPRGQEFVLMNAFSLAVTLFAAIAAVVFVLLRWSDVLSSSSVNILNLVMTLPVWRVLVIVDAFRNICIAFANGLMAIGKTSLLLLIVFYFYCAIAHAAFKGIDFNNPDYFSATLNYNTLGETALTSETIPSTILIGKWLIVSCVFSVSSLHRSWVMPPSV